MTDVFPGVQARYPYYSQSGVSPTKYLVWWNHNSDIVFPWDITPTRGDAASSLEEMGPNFPCPNFVDKFKIGSGEGDVNVNCISECSSNPPTLSDSTNNWDGSTKTTGTIVTYKYNSNGATQFSFCSITGSWTSVESCSTVSAPTLPTPETCAGTTEPPTTEPPTTEAPTTEAPTTEPPTPLSCDSDGGKLLLTPTDFCKVICSEGYEQGLDYPTNRKPTSWTVSFPKGTKCNDASVNFIGSTFDVNGDPNVKQCKKGDFVTIQQGRNKKNVCGMWNPADDLSRESFQTTETGKIKLKFSSKKGPDDVGKGFQALVCCFNFI